MNTTYILIAILIANLAVTIYYGSALVKALAIDADTTPQPDAQTRGIGGGGAMRR